MTNAEIVRWVIEHFEGFKYTDNPVDTGGATKYGITLRTLQYYRRLVTGNPFLIATKADVKALTIDEAVACGVRVFMVEPRIERIPSWRVRLMVYDYGFHSGQQRAIKSMQQALGMANVDGIIGPITLEAVTYAEEWRTALRVNVEREVFMQNLIRAKPSQREFMLGWWVRTTDLEYVLAWQ